jgi:hypothetical protein
MLIREKLIGGWRKYRNPSLSLNKTSHVATLTCKNQNKPLASDIGCSFKFLLKVGLEESIVNAPFVPLQNKNRNNANSEVRFKQLIRDL